MVTARLKPCPFKASYHCGKPIRGRDTASKGTYYPANASRNMADNSSALSTGGRQAKFVHTIATDGFAFNAGRLGMVSASTGGKFCATASLSVKWTTDLLTANGAAAALRSSAAFWSSPTMTAWVCGRDIHVAAMP